MTRNEHPLTERLSTTLVRPPALALALVGGWIALEVGLRRGLVPRLDPVVGAAAADWTVLLVGFPAMAAVLTTVALRVGHRPADWGYDPSLRAVGVGLAGVVLAVPATAATAYVDSALFGLGETSAGFASAVADALAANPELAVVLVLGNGLAVPVAEELVWRGLVQSSLTEAWGAVAGIGTTAALFALKHVVVDGSVARLTTLLVLALLFGVVRHRYGTVASTVTHVGVNMLSTAALVAVALA
jgi:membrane protease YdiL (CAAX protease family)